MRWVSQGLNPSYELHDKGMIADPVGKVKSVVFTEEGLQRAKALFEGDVQEVTSRVGRQSVGWVERTRPPKLNPAEVQAKPIETIAACDGFRTGSTHPTNP